MNHLVVPVPRWGIINRTLEQDPEDHAGILALGHTRIENTREIPLFN